MANKPILQVINATKRYAGKTVVDRLSFDLYKGEIVGLLGPNGAGKTTTMRMIVGLISITEGDVLVHGHSIKHRYVQAVSHLGGVIENPEFYPFFSGYENLRHYARMYADVSEQRIAEVVALIGLSDVIHKRSDAYSLGMKQRLGIAQALLHKPSLLVLDEPTNGLDPAGIREMRDYFKRIARSEGVAILVSSHLLSEIELMCDRVVIIQNGKLVDTQTVSAPLEDNQASVIAFEVDDPPKARQILAARYPEGADGIVAGTHTVSLPVERERITEILALLLAAQLRIFSVQPVRKNLEDRFLEKTGGNRIV
ncbi:ABC transporter ATP-binding protein [Brevibacillus fulvus]|uniref:ABC-2 type transport system ATP-binding protein n=1 Tax=Brevibacillus fulvus TaxID=1125967 RepID=A0A939BUT1_9BACL|nr:ABC transporter ATP-binding protein [Brevibacillus fulvus]MBM7589921.1 ABC-2 type transport system ATP-binding protein [Brevibacillus fulvus]